MSFYCLVRRLPSLHMRCVTEQKRTKSSSESVQLRIADGIIGEVLANRAVDERLSQGFDPMAIGMTQQEFDRLPESEQDDLIQDWLIATEIEAEIEHNPITVAVYELWKDLARKLGDVRHSVRYVSYPDLDQASTLAERVKLLNAAIMEGAVCTVHTEQFGDIKRTVWLPSFKTPLYSGLGLVEEIARLIALDSVRRLMEA